MITLYLAKVSLIVILVSLAVARYIASDEAERQWHEKQLKVRLGIGNEREN